MGKLYDRLLDLLYPTRCILCRRELAPGKPDLCPRCREAIVTPENSCVPGAAEKALHRFKFGGCAAYASAFGALIAERVYAELWGRYDLITWVPVSRERLRSRGYDQSMLLAKEMAKRLCQSVEPTLKKRRGVRRQSLVKSAEERRANIMGVFTVPKPDKVRGRRVLLIDDIVTTGSTLSECAKMLLAAGAEEVVCAVLAKTPRGG